MSDKTRAGTNHSDLDTWIEKVEAIGQLKRITAEVDSDLETSTLTYMVGRDEGSPALLFENIKGHPGHKALYNMIGCNLDRFCLSIGVEPVDHPLDAAQILKDKMHLTQSPVEIDGSGASCMSPMGNPLGVSSSTSPEARIMSP